MRWFAVANYRWRKLRHLNFIPIQNRNALRIWLDRKCIPNAFKLLADDRMQRLPDRLAPLGEAAALTGRQLGPAQVLVDLDQVGLQALGCLDDDGVDLGPSRCSATICSSTSTHDWLVARLIMVAYMMQDDCRKLSRALSNTPGARLSTQDVGDAIIEEAKT